MSRHSQNGHAQRIPPKEHMVCAGCAGGDCRKCVNQLLSRVHRPPICVHEHEQRASVLPDLLTVGRTEPVEW